MSLYGTGRKEGIVAVCLIGILTATAHLLAALRFAELGLASLGEAAYITIVTGAVGGMLTYRFLRAQGRSRYAAFLGGIAYGMSPLFAGLIDSPREQIAAALVPLGLEAAAQLDRPTTQRRWLPYAGLCLALPFAVGVTVIATLATTLALAMVALTALRCGRGADRLPLRQTGASLLLGGIALSNLIWLAPMHAWLGSGNATQVHSVLSGETTPMVIVRVVGPFLVWFALLGILRRQRNVMTSFWLVLALVGAAPTVMLAIPGVSASLPNVFTAWAIPAISWWLSVLAITVMGTAGLDDWLDQPQRRRGAHLWLLVLTLLVAPALPLAGASINPVHLATVLGTFAVLATVTLAWRRLGVLRFKNMLTGVALIAFAMPVILQSQAPAAFGAPLGESAPRSFERAVELLMTHPWWHFAGIAGAVLLAGLIATVQVARHKRAS